MFTVSSCRICAVLLVLVLSIPMTAYAQSSDLDGARFEGPNLASSEAGADVPFSSGLLGDEGVDLESKSTSKAVLYSLLLPGLGQSYLGESGQAKIFYALDIAIWTSFVVFTVQADLREDEYQTYAQTFAGVTTTSHSDDYFSILTQFDSARDYADDLMDEGRFALYPDVDTEALEQYFVDNRVSDYEVWVWQSADHRRAYQDRRSASKRADRRALYSIAAAVVNRVASAFFAYRTAKRPQLEENTQQTRFSIELGAPQRQTTGGSFAGISMIQSF